MIDNNETILMHIDEKQEKYNNKNESTNQLLELAEAINLTGGKPYPEQLKKIISQFAEGLFTYEDALDLIKGTFKKPLE